MFANLLTPYLLLAVVAAYYLVPYLKTWRLSDIPSPGLASFTNFWLLLKARGGRRFNAVHDAHKKHGKMVRIAPHHISIADDSAIQAIYGHGNGFLKAYVLWWAVDYLVLTTAQ